MRGTHPAEPRLPCAGLLAGPGGRACLAVLGILAASARPAPAQGRIVEDSVHSTALENNLLGGNPTRHFLIYLPPSYAQDDGRRYPAVYLLHAFGRTPATWVDGTDQGLSIATVMDSLIRTGAVRELIVVMPDGSNSLGGSVFTNSATTGGWETYLVRDLVRTVEARYRTIRRGASRGIAGYAMGAGAALRLAMRFPAGFGAVYAMSPNARLPCGQLAPADSGALLDLSARAGQDSLDFESRECLAYAAAWSPDSTRPPFFMDLPFLRTPSGIVPDTTVVERWHAWMLLEMASRYREGLVRLRGIALDVGTGDPDVRGVVQLDSLLTRLRVRHAFERYPGDHTNRIRDRVTLHLLPFFSATLNFDPEGS